MCALDLDCSFHQSNIFFIKHGDSDYVIIFTAAKKDHVPSLVCWIVCLSAGQWKKGVERNHSILERHQIMGWIQKLFFTFVYRILLCVGPSSPASESSGGPAS